jgi:hypothetical protein
LRKASVLLLASAAAAVGVACSQASTPAKSPANPPTLPKPDQFVRTVTNPYFPLIPGTTFVSKGNDEGRPATDVLRVTHATKVIQGIRTTVIDDRVYINGHVEERTTDWYAQDKAGNVWYLGENTATLDKNGKVKSREGTWRAGVNGAHAGIFMPAHLRVGQTGQQEYYSGHAEDRFKVVSLTARVNTPAVKTSRGLRTQETTRLEPGVVDEKIYARGYGTVLEQTVKGGRERYVLVSVHRPKT